MSHFADKNILFLHHYEICWAKGMEGFGVTFDEYTDNLCHFIVTSRPRIDHVVVTRWEEYGAGEEHYALLRHLERLGITCQFETVPYGQNESSFSPKMQASLIPSRKTRDITDPDIREVIHIEPWMHELRAASSVQLAGAFEGECICDAEDILEHVRGLDGHERIEGLIIGSGAAYDYGQAPVWKDYLCDEYGEPLVLYHGTSTTFNRFQPSKTGAQGPGIYMTDAPSVYGTKTMRLQVRMNNPYFFYPSEDSLEAMINPELIEEVLPSDLAEEVLDRINNEGESAYGFEVQNALKNMGYDGIIMVYPFGEPVIPGAEGSAVVIAFDPEQVEILSIEPNRQVEESALCCP